MPNEVLEYQSAKFNKSLILGYAGVAELADALDLGSSAARCGGSSPLARTTKNYTSGSDSVVECDLAKVDVASSNLVFRSTPLR